MKRLFFLSMLIYIFLFVSSANAFFISHYRGVTSGKFLEIPTFATVRTFNGGGSGFFGQPENIYLNPAGLFRITKPILSLAYVPYLGNTKLSSVAFATTFIAKSSVGLGLKYLSDKQFSYNEFGVGSGTFKNSDLEVDLAFARKVYFNLQTGITIKYLSSTLQNYKASAVAFDLGMMGRAFSKSVDYGIVIQNMGFGEKFDKEISPLPLIIKGGIYYEYENFSVASDLIAVLDDIPYLSFNYGYKFSEKFDARIGFVVNDKYVNLQDFNIELNFHASGFVAQLCVSPHPAGRVFSAVPIFTIKKYF